MAVVSLQGTSRFPEDASPYAKGVVARDMGRRGANFVAAALLLRDAGGDAYVWRHELCVGIELALKSALLRRDFDSYWPRLKQFGHKLVRLADETCDAYAVGRPNGDVRRQLERLADMYAAHQLRYSSGLAILFDPSQMEYEHVLRRLVAVLRLLAK